ATVLLTENLFDLNAQIVDSRASAKIHIRLPSQEEITTYLEFLAGEEPSLAQASPLPLPALAEKMVGLSRLTIKGTVLRAIRNDQPLSPEFLARIKKETIEKEAGDRLVFLESRRTLDDVAGHHEAKSWLRQDATLLRRGATRALPMGYLVTGRIGTGKTYLVECFAGECGVPFVELKNFRDKWVGATEGNLEKIFAILHALGQVVVFVDEADQATGRRGGGEGDSGLSGRIYAMLAKEMADTRNRGRILWIFATSRPDLLEVDLKRPGRLDVHIPLFPPATLEDQQDLFLATARKLKIELARGEIPPLPFAGAVSGNEIEGVLVRALREFELQGAGEKGETLPALIARVLKEYRPSAHTRRLELMDLLAVQECTDGRFLPERFRGLTPEATLRRIRELSDPTQTEQPNDHE
ncbi:MAG TPA: AAA family ATPase, partial [Candidatus Aminicenantes bacterium]|nr:AAA family ATPase [Candidatus Aminicenantes bacterium]